MTLAELDGRSVKSRKLRIEEAHVEFGIVSDEPRALDEGAKLIGDLREFLLRGEELAREPMHAKSLLRHVALGIEIDVEAPARGDEIGDLDEADLDDAMTVRGIEPRRLRVEHDLPHQFFSCRRAATMARTSARAASRPLSV